MPSPERRFIPDEERNRAPESPIMETKDSISYLGVKLEKAADCNSQFVPSREQYADYINDEELALPMQRDIATAWLNGEPLLLEGGTSLGKTTTVKKMASELGYEVHYVNLNGTTDVEDLMGKYIPNPFRLDRSKLADEQYAKITEQWKAHTAGMDPALLEAKEYIFADGKVTSGLRREKGKRKVIILDEFNAAAPNVLIRLHEILDALERGGDVILSEDASEAVGTSKEDTKVVALTNPPGKGYFGREPLDPAQLRRWVYKKLPTELPDATFSFATDNLFGSKRGEHDVPQEMYRRANNAALLPEQLPEIVGMAEMREKYKEFHRAAKELLKNKSIGEDQPQPFAFDDRMEPRRVRDFILRFYRGDINETMRQALEYYYVNKLESDMDKEKLGELIRLVQYTPKPGESKRRSLEFMAESRETKVAERRETESNPEGHDPEKFLTDVFNWIETNEGHSREEWRWATSMDGTWVDMQYEVDNDYGLPLRFTDKDMIARFDFNESGRSIYRLIEKIKQDGKKIVSINSNGHWYLKIVETRGGAKAVEKPTRAERRETETNIEGRDPEEFLNDVFDPLSENLDLANGSTGRWNWCFSWDGSLVNMFYAASKLPNRQIHERRPVKFDPGEGGGSIKSLIKKLKDSGKRVVSVDSNDSWYLRVIGGDKKESKPAPVERRESGGSRDAEKFLREFFAYNSGFRDDTWRWTISVDGSLVDMNFVGGVPPQFIDTSAPTGYTISLAEKGNGIENLIRRLKGKRVQTVKSPRGFYLRVI